jgi:hypothetical protein
MKGEFQRQNRKLQLAWKKWGDLIKVATAAFVIFAVYAMLREGFAGSLLDRSAEALKIEAKAIAHLPAKQANEAGVSKFIKEQRKRTQEIKTLEALLKMNSAMDVLRKLSAAMPPNTVSKMAVSKLSIQDERVEIQGFVSGTQEVPLIQQALQGMALNNRADSVPNTTVTPVPTQNIPFAFGLNVDRGMTPSTKE